MFFNSSHPDMGDPPPTVPGCTAQVVQGRPTHNCRPGFAGMCDTMVSYCRRPTPLTCPPKLTLKELLDQAVAKAEQGNWYPASGGREQSFLTRNHRRLLYCWQPSTGRHAYIDCDTDLILSNEDAQLALGV